MARYHANTAAGAGAGAAALASEWAPRLPAVLQEVKGAVAGAARSGIEAGPTLYTGTAGVAFALARAARCDPGLLPLAARLAESAAGRGAALRRRVAESVLDGQAGVAAVQAIVTSAANPSAPLDEPLSRFRACCAQAASAPGAGSDEVLYGRAGCVLGALTLNKQLGRGAVDDATLGAICAAMLASGRALSARLGLAAGGGPPLFYTWPEGGGRGHPYLGAAHGLLGIVHALLHCWDLLPSLDARARADALATLDYALSLESSVPGRGAAGGHWPVMARLGGLQEDAAGREPVLVHWCHGSPGVAMTLCRAFEVTGDLKYLAAAVSAGQLVWERGLLTKGPGLCHGVSGNAYALLACWRATRDPLWLARAQRFAVFIGEPGGGGGRGDWGAPDHPASLFEGLGGALVLLSDLTADAEGARFPFYEV
ncbi:hypothetical protein Rsub_00603 [Raphidocelis subcapitata]|uniref:LanC 3 n=1 Tax=Raphidocelis subcapitata TaxID=307507 RepID=A0A2V0NKN2_9CHLO|nr:hypothetical protein Rsub_00603 [Raphidocelis subcapitata]|eukprot:GBF87891.1 hypothetical protein Rsub_00603 [Raphidocelis subcapitata]